jgi:hypothetical protein
MQSGARRGKMKKRANITLTDEQAYARLLASGVTKTSLAKIIGIKKQAVTRWTSIPVKYVKKISDSTGVSRASLRPSDFG